MKALNSHTNLERFFGDFCLSKKRILFVDYDGTISATVKERDKTIPYPGVNERIRVLSKSPQTRLIIISGRCLSVLKQQLIFENYPEMIGSHGLERYIPGKGETQIAIDEVTKRGLKEAWHWAGQTGLGEYCEIKLAGLAFHWRGLSECKANRIRDEVVGRWKNSAASNNLELHFFDGGIELRYSKMDKGQAVESILRETGDRPIVAYLGDDQTDEEAFAALGDRGLKILVREKLRPTRADLQILPPKELLTFLDLWIEADNQQT